MVSALNRKLLVKERSRRRKYEGMKASSDEFVPVLMLCHTSPEPEVRCDRPCSPRPTANKVTSAGQNAGLDVK